MRSPRPLLTVATLCLALTQLAAHGRAQFVYEAQLDDGVVRVLPGDTIPFPALEDGATSSTVQIRVLNLTAEDESLSAIRVDGAAFRAEPPTSFPVTLGPNGSISFDVTFEPPAPGDFGGRLTVNDQIFSLSGSRSGAVLTSYLRMEGETIALDGASRVSLPTLTAGQTLLFSIVVENRGVSPGAVTFVGLSGFGFSLLSSPGLPMTVGPGESYVASASVAPTTAGAAIGVLRINDRSVQLETLVTNPPPVSEILITNLPNPAEPGTQPAIGLELPEPYPTDLSGTLTLTFASEAFVPDPNIVFSTGGSQVDVFIPAGETKAVLGPGFETIALQTGTTAGVIALSTKLWAAGNDVTGSRPPRYAVSILANRPVISDVYVQPVSDFGFDLIISGFSTVRELDSLELEFGLDPAVDVEKASFTVDVRREFDAWYKSAGSRSFGSQFSATIRVSLSVEMEALESVNVAAANRFGVSSPMTLDLRETLDSDE